MFRSSFECLWPRRLNAWRIPPKNWTSVSQRSPFAENSPRIYSLFRNQNVLRQISLQHRFTTEVENIDWYRLVNRHFTSSQDCLPTNTFTWFTPQLWISKQNRSISIDIIWPVGITDLFRSISSAHTVGIGLTTIHWAPWAGLNNIIWKAGKMFDWQLISLCRTHIRMRQNRYSKCSRDS